MAARLSTCWSDKETVKLIEIWGDGKIQAMLEGSRRNKDTFVRISKEMSEAGFEKTGEQCSSKIKKLRCEYKKIKDKRGKTGEEYKCWKFFEHIDGVLGHKPATRPSIVVESTQSSDTGIADQKNESIIHDNDDNGCSEDDQSLDTSLTSRSRSETLGIEKKARKRKNDRMD